MGWGWDLRSRSGAFFFLYPRHLCRRVYSFRFSVRPFVCSLVRSLVRSFVRSLVRYSGTFVEFMSKFLLKFLCWCISHELMIRNHSYFNHRYPIGFALLAHLSRRLTGELIG